MAWYCAQTYPRCDHLATAELRRQRFHVLSLTTEKSFRERTRRVPLFPTYLFINFNVLLDYWKPIWSTYGIKRLFSSSPEHPTIVPDKAMESFLTIHDKVSAPVALPPLAVLNVGESAKILTGPFIDKEGVCDWSDDERASLWLNIMQQRVKVSFHLTDLQRMVSSDGQTCPETP